MKDPSADHLLAFPYDRRDELLHDLADGDPWTIRLYRERSDEDLDALIANHWEEHLRRLGRRTRTVDQLLATQGPPEFLIGDLLPLPSLVFLWGAWGSCKSFLALDWSLSIASGIDWMGKATRQGPTIYVAGEGRLGVPDRCAAWIEDRGAHPGSEFRFWDQMINLDDQTEVQDFIDTVRASAPKLVVVDTLAHAMAGSDETSFAAMSRVGAALEQIRDSLQATVLCVHHGTKDSGSFRGHSSLPARADVIFQMKPTSQAVKLLMTKSRDTECLAPIQLTPRTTADSLVLVPSAIPIATVKRATPAMTAEAKILQAFTAAPTGLTRAELLDLAGSKTTMYRLIRDLDLGRDHGRFTLP